jgi:hypothetical protein
MYGPVKGKECGRTRTNKEIKDMLHGEDTAEVIKSISDGIVMLKECSLFSRKMPKLNATATIEGVIKEDEQRKGWRDEAEEYINIMGTNNRQAMVTDRRE